MKKKILIISIVVLSIGALGYFSWPYVQPLKSGVVWNNCEIIEEEEILYKFVMEKLTTSDGGIKTNYSKLKSDGDITKGHAVLSESQGIMLLYYLDRNEKNLFDRNLEFIEEKMLLDNGLLSWRIEADKASETSATIDDLRVIKALLLANERWGDIKYRSVAIKISKGIKNELIDEDILADFNDGYSMSKTSTLCYLDLPTLKLLSQIDSDYKKIYNTSLDILSNGYMGSSIPLFKKEYNREKESYDDGDLDTLLSAIVLLNRAEVGEDVQESVDWLKEKFREDKGIFSLYSPVTGEKTSNIESTSIYAILLQVAEEIGDKELSSMCLYKLKTYQVSDKNSEIYGAFGDSNTMEVFSFDNLNALLAFRKLNREIASE